MSQTWEQLMADHSAIGREPEVTEFNVIVEGRPDGPVRIPSVNVQRKYSTRPEAGLHLAAIPQVSGF